MKKILLMVPLFSPMINSSLIENIKITNLFNNQIIKDPKTKADLRHFKDIIDNEPNTKNRPCFDKNNIQNNNLNINYPDFIHSSSDKRQNIFIAIATAVDEKYGQDETKAGISFSQKYFYDLAISSDYDSELYITPFDQTDNGDETLNDTKNSFSNFTMNTLNEIKSYNLRISNQFIPSPSNPNEQDWSKNTLSFDVSLNICNFDENEKTVLNKDDLSDMYTNSKAPAIGYVSDHVIQTPWKIFHIVDLFPQMNNYDTAEFFLDPNNNFTYHFNIHVSAHYNNYKTQEDNRIDDTQTLNLNNIKTYDQVKKENPKNPNGGEDCVTNVLSQGFIRGHVWTAGYNSFWNNYDSSDLNKIYLMGAVRTHLDGKTMSPYGYNITYTGLKLDANINWSVFDNQPF